MTQATQPKHPRQGHRFAPDLGLPEWGDLPSWRVTREELGKRIRAARAYADLDQEEVAFRVGMGAKTLSMSEHGLRDTKRWELWGIAEVCGLPRSFFEDEEVAFPMRRRPDEQGEAEADDATVQQVERRQQERDQQKPSQVQRRRKSV